MKPRGVELLEAEACLVKLMSVAMSRRFDAYEAVSVVVVVGESMKKLWLEMTR